MEHRVSLQSENEVMSSAMPAAILAETIAAVTDILGRELDDITVERAVIGLFFTGVKLHHRPCRRLRDADQDDPRGGVLSLLGDGDAVSRQDEGPAGARGDARKRSPTTASAAASASPRSTRSPNCAGSAGRNPAVELLRGVDAFDANNFGAGRPDRRRRRLRAVPQGAEAAQAPFLVLEKDPAR